MDIREELFKNQDLKYKSFHSKLLPTTDEGKIIGVKIPILRKIAKEAVKENIQCKSDYYEEMMINGFMIGYSKMSCDEYINALTDFVPLIDNWAVCDCVAATCKFAKKYQDEVWEFLLSLLNGNEYEVRFALVMMLDYYINEKYVCHVVNIYKNIHTDLYYINMAAAWGLSVAFVKYQSSVMPLLENGVLDDRIHNKTIQKICDSFRVEQQTKEYLKTFRRKNI